MTNTHDFKLYKQSRLPIPQMLKVCVDTGYLGITKFHENIEMPKKKTKLNPLSKEDKLENKKKSSKRIPIEHIKPFRCFRYSNYRFKNWIKFSNY